MARRGVQVAYNSSLVVNMVVTCQQPHDVGKGASRLGGHGEKVSMQCQLPFN